MMSAAWRMRPELQSDVSSVITALEEYCRQREWAGYDPYDALNSDVLTRAGITRSRLGRIAATQILKRSPVNFRKVLAVAPHQNPKALALFLSFYSRRSSQGDPLSKRRAAVVATRLLELRTRGELLSCWGYSFPWQGRMSFAPRFAPNLVCTVFAANALIDAYQILGDPALLKAACSAGHYVATELYWEQEDAAGFAYPLPDVRTPVHNAGFLGSALLCRIATITGDSLYLHRALAVARYSVAQQRSDGAWYYGMLPTNQWIDNFHTGFNLCALRSIESSTGSGEFVHAIKRGLEFYVQNFFTRSGAPKYYHNRAYPIDIHSAAQSVITLSTFAEECSDTRRLLTSVLEWTLENMWDRRGFFYYRVLRGITIRTPYMRWSQAWMLLALSMLPIQAPAPCK